MDARQCVLSLGRYERAFNICLSEAQLVLDLHNTRIERYRALAFGAAVGILSSSHYGQLVNSLPVDWQRILQFSLVNTVSLPVYSGVVLRHPVRVLGATQEVLQTASLDRAVHA
eukprot:5282298-Pyramimonas_sp.AAC.1